MKKNKKAELKDLNLKKVSGGAGRPGGAISDVVSSLGDMAGNVAGGGVGSVGVDVAVDTKIDSTVDIKKASLNNSASGSGSVVNSSNSINIG